MALSLAHATAGYLAYEAVRPAGAHRPLLLGAAVALANGPDLDFVPGLLVGNPAIYHRGVTHTLAAVVVVAALVALGACALGQGRRPALRAGLWAAAVWTSHLVLDYFTINAAVPAGARFLWPLSDRYWIAPVTPLPEIVIDSTGRRAFFASVFNAGTLRVWGGELLLLVVAIAAVHALRAWQARPTWRDVREET